MPSSFKEMPQHHRLVDVRHPHFFTKKFGYVVERLRHLKPPFVLVGFSWVGEFLCCQSGLDPCSFGDSDLPPMVVPHNRFRCLQLAAKAVPSGPTLSGGCCGARYGLALRSGLNGPKSTAHAYLSFPLLLSPSNKDSCLCPVTWATAYVSSHGRIP